VTARSTVALFAPADENLAHEILRAHCVAHGEGMAARHQHDERVPVHHGVPEVVGRLHAQEGQGQPAAGERFGEIRE
jgi:hypothetical protein